MNQPTSIPVPAVLRELIASNNTLLQNYQQELSNRVIGANFEMMRMLGLDPQDGWRLDVQTMTYTKEAQVQNLEENTEEISSNIAE